MEQNTGSNLFGLSIDQTGRTHLLDAAKWARFLAIVGFVFITLFALALIFGGTFFINSMFSQYDDSPDFDESTSKFAAAAVIIYYIIIFVIVLFAYIFLYRFAVNMKMALNNNNQENLNRSFMYLKVLYRYWGILTIICLVFFFLALMIGLMTAGRMM